LGGERREGVCFSLRFYNDKKCSFLKEVLNNSFLERIGEVWVNYQTIAGKKMFLYRSDSFENSLLGVV
jgi:hypothetical protein